MALSMADQGAGPVLDRASLCFGGVLGEGSGGIGQKDQVLSNDAQAGDIGEDGVLALTWFVGCADVNCAVAGALLGSQFGLDGLL